MSKKFFLILVLSLFTVQAGLAQPADYFLERVAIHVRLMESNLETAKLGSQFQGDLQRLAADVEMWGKRFLEEDDLEEIRGQLDDHGHMLRASALRASLDKDQNTTLDLLLLELERTSQNLTPDHFVQTAIQIPYDLPSRERGTVRAYNQWGDWDDSWGELCPPVVDPLGPYFGRPFHPDRGAYWW